MEDKKPQTQEAPQPSPAVAAQLEQLKTAVPDTSQRLFDFLVGNLKPIAIACGVVLLAAAVYAGVNSWRAKAAAKASDALGLILIQKNDAKERIEALDQFLKDAPSSLKPTVQLELAAAAMIDKQYDKALAAWDGLEKDGAADMKVIAAIGKAKCLLMTGKAQDALTLLEGLKAKSPEAYALPITRQIAVAAEQAGNAQVAQAAYAELAEKDSGAGKPFFQFKANQLRAGS